jgi:Tol biopolymer transport system component
MGERERTRALALRLALAVCVLSAAVSGFGAATAGATFPGANGQLTFTRTVGAFSDVWVMDADGQNQTVLANDPATNQRGSSFSADGERVVFATDLPGGSTGIVVVNVDGSDATLVTDDAGDFASPHFSPSGQQVVYQTRAGTNSDIAIVDVDGQNLTPLTSGPDSEFNPSFSPDGQRIVFERFGGGPGGVNVWTMDPDGQNQVRLTGGSTDDAFPSFSPDGGLITYIQAPPGDQPGDVWVMDSNGQNQIPLTNTPGVAETGPVFSPDGQKIAFSQFPSGGGSDGEIVVMDAGGQNPVALTQNSDFDNQVDWQPLNPPACSLTGPSKSKSVREVVVTVLCVNENATANASGQLTAKVPKSGFALASKKKTVALVPSSAPVPEGTQIAIPLQIPKKGRKALKKSGKAGNAAVTVTVTDDLGESTTLTQAIKVKPKKKKK